MHRLAYGSRISHAPAAGEVSGSATDVYPRTGGGTSRRRPRIPMSAAFFDGLSPHGRGNRLCGRRGQSFDGSIPVRAGEPWTGNLPRPCRRVYPRTGGGTRGGAAVRGARQGLSPHGAGEPRCCPVRLAKPRVYPRTGGGTIAEATSKVSDEGLSPHGRGNRRCGLSGREHPGSIPARAGEPH